MARGQKLVVPIGVDDRELAAGVKRAQARIAAASNQIGRDTMRASDQVTRGFAKADRAWTRFSGRYEASTRRMMAASGRLRAALVTGLVSGLTAALVGGGLRRSLHDLIDSMSTLANTADKLGLTTDRLQELRYAAQQHGVESRALDVGYQRFTRRLAEAARGTGVLKDIVREFDLDTTNADRAFRQFADVLQATPSQAERVRLAFKAFDTEGVSLVNVLQRGSAGLDDMSSQAQALGITLGDLPAKLRDTGDAIERLEQASASAFARMQGDLTTAAYAWASLKATAVQTLEAMVFGMPGVNAGLGMLAIDLQGIHVAPLSVLREELERLQQVGGMEVPPSYDRMFPDRLKGPERIQAIRAEIARRDALAASATPGGAPPDAGAGGDQGSLRRLESIVRSTQTPAERLRAEIGLLTQAVAQGGPQVDAYAEALRRKQAELLKLEAPLTKHPRLVRDSYKYVDAQAEAYKKLLPVLRGARTEQDRLEEIVRQLTAAIADGGPHVAEYARALAFYRERLGEAVNGTDEAAEAFERMRESIASSLASVLTGAQSFSDSMRNVLASLAQRLISSGLMSIFDSFGGGGGGFLADVFGFKAEGGPVGRGRPQVVGERGREVFVPQQPGVIVPAHRIGQRRGKEGTEDAVMDAIRSVWGGVRDAVGGLFEGPDSPHGGPRGLGAASRAAARSGARGRGRDAFDRAAPPGTGPFDAAAVGGFAGDFGRGMMTGFAGGSLAAGVAARLGFGFGPDPRGIRGRPRTGGQALGQFTGMAAQVALAGLMGPVGMVMAALGFMTNAGAFDRGGGGFMNAPNPLGTDTSFGGGQGAGGFGSGPGGSGPGGPGPVGRGGRHAEGLSGQRAEGGPVAGGGRYLVGERGREVFIPRMPRMPAAIRAPRMPAMAGAAGRAGGIVYVDASGADVAAVARLERVVASLDRSLEFRAVSAVVQAKRRQVV